MTIYGDLLSKIKDKEWPEGGLLPSENELTSVYGTSRETIRKALNLLSQNGYIQKVRGKGSVVIHSSKLPFPVSGIVSFKELAIQQRLSVRTLVTNIAYIEPQNKINEILNPEMKARVWNVNRIREIDGERVILDKDYFREDIVPVLDEGICENSIYEYAEKKLGLAIGFAQKEITVEKPTEEDLEMLDLDGFSNIVVIRSQVSLEDATLFQITESRHRPDKFRFVDFARRVRSTPSEA